LTEEPVRAKSRRAAIAVKLAALTPLALLALAYAALPGFRATLNAGVSLFVRGDVAGLRAWGESLGPWAPLATSALMIAQAIAAPIPAVLVTATNSLLFGPFWGGVLSIVSATIAACVCWGLARLFGDTLASFLVSPAALTKADAIVSRHGTMAVLVARLVPFVPFDPVSFVAGLARMPLAPFFWATLVGQAPAGMAYSYLAQEIDRPRTLVVAAVAVFAGLVLLGLAARRFVLRRAVTPP
jgi:uncharacterized membrane protein YdjX (TVP38/TMEM64 family)